MTGPCLFQVVGLVSESSLQMYTSGNDSVVFTVYSWGGRGLVKLISFRNFLKRLLKLFSFRLNELPCRIKCFNLSDNCHTTEVRRPFS